MHFDDCFQYIGEFGPFQRRQVLMLSMVMFTSSVHVMMTVFTLDVPEHRCASPSVENESFSRKFTEESNHLGECKIHYNRNLTHQPGNTSHLYNQLDDVNISTCSDWVYDKSVFTSTVSTQMDLVCDRKLLKSHLLMFLMVGQTLGCFIGGTAADILGRKHLLLCSLLLHLLASVITTWANSIPTFGLLYLTNGLCLATAYCCSFMLALEQVGPKWRHVTGVGASVFWGIGMLWICFLAYFIRDWQNLQLAASIPSILYAFFLCFVPESPRWLAGKGRYSEAEDILHSMARSNGKQLPASFQLCKEESGSPEVRNNQKVLVLIRHPRLIVRTVIVLFQWFTCSLTYYGLNLNAGQLNGDIFLNFFLLAIFEMAACILVIGLLTKVGRKTIYTYALLLGGIGCLLTVVPTLIGGKWEAWAVRVLAMTGKFGITGAFATIWLFTPEMFPTTLRVSITGASSCSARIGAVAASYMALLTVPGKVGQLLPQIIFGCLALIAGCLAFTLPETHMADLPDSMTDALEMKRPESKQEKHQVEDILLM